MRIATVSALALLGFSFLDWYGSEPAGQAHFQTDAGGSAWQALTLVPLVLAATVAVTLVAAVLRLARSGWRPQVPLSAAIAVLGGVSALLILVRIVFPPDLGSVGGIPLDATLSLSAFLALLAACGVAYGGYRAMSEEGDSFEAIASRLSVPPSAPGERRGEQN
ncbi:MAG: hypothetical protein ABW065_02615 [Solirubrobacterales bacterium]